VVAVVDAVGQKLVTPGPEAILRPAGGVLPLRFGGQPAAGPVTKRRSIIAADLDDGIIIHAANVTARPLRMLPVGSIGNVPVATVKDVAPALRLGRRLVARVGHEGGEPHIRDLRLVEPELIECHIVGRPLVVVAVLAAHAEGTGINHSSGAGREGLNTRIADIGGGARFLPRMPLLQIQRSTALAPARERCRMREPLQTAECKRRQHQHVTQHRMIILPKVWAPDYRTR